ncbi:MAG TPA: TIGR02300 family protein [Alphaproteobacteria bacterium]|nr:TIGR02300 family protein [Alphaproteobacteria bacterium]
MSKAEWGTKRICGECGTRYYDMRRDPPTCPKCGAVFEAVVVKAKRKPAIPEEKVAPKPRKKPVDDLELEAKVLENGAEDEEEDELIEDASELGEDEEDVAEVIETKVEGEGDAERER